LLIQIWFQNRRQKAKLLKKTVEQRTREVLEEATKRTEAEQAQRVHTHTTQSPVQLQSESSQTPSTPKTFHQRALSSNENTPTQQQLSASPYPSPQEASYASLARSIAVAAAAAAAAANGPQSCPPTVGIPQLGHNPFFNSPMMSRSISTFSECSTIDTPISATPSYASTPFEYLGTGELVETPLPSNDPSNIGVAKQFPDFAAAVDAHNLKRPATLLHPQHAQRAPEPTTRPGSRPTLSRMNSCPADFIDAFGSVALGSHVVEKPPTLASVAEQATNKRRRPRLSPLGIGMARSKSSMGDCQSANAAYFQTDPLRFSPTLNRIIHSTPSSPVERLDASPLRASQFKRDSPQKHTNTFLSVDGPPTPISPVGKQNPVDISPTLSLARAAGLTQLKRPQVALNTEDIFSPPTTPAHSLKMQRGLSFSTDGFSDVFLGSFDDHLSSSPSQFFIPDGMSDYASNMDDVFPSSYDSSSFNMSDDFSNYLEL
jgi:hypothetical protein